MQGIYNWFGLLPSKAPSLNQMASPTAQSQQPPVTLPPQSHPRPLRREGAQYFLSAAEEALEAAMMRSSSPVEESALGKRVREGDESIDHDGSEPDAEPASSQQQQVQPSLGNVISSTLRYAARKKLRPEQRDEVEAFLSVRHSYFLWKIRLFSSTCIGYGTRPPGQVICLHPLNRKQGGCFPIGYTAVSIIRRTQGARDQLSRPEFID